jgi:hypothetical protein
MISEGSGASSSNATAVLKVAVESVAEGANANPQEGKK